MRKSSASFLGGLIAQLLVVTVLPLTLLLVVIAFGSVSLHQQDMRALVGERDERAVQSASAALASELHHRAAAVSNMVVFAETSGLRTIVPSTQDLASDFEGGFAYLDGSRRLIESSNEESLWTSVKEPDHLLASANEPGPIFSVPLLDERTNQFFVIVSRYSSQEDLIVAAAFSPEKLAQQVLAASYPANDHLTIYLIDGSQNLLFASGDTSAFEPVDHPGVSEALDGKTGTTYVQRGKLEHVVAYSPVPGTSWALITEEEWQSVVSLSFQTTQMAPLVLVPAFILAMLALWFVARRIIQPLQKLEIRAAALARGDFEAIQEPVSGISEVQHLQLALSEMSRKVQTAQEGLHGYIGAITSAQEEERLRLARELHDDTIQSVIALKQRVQLAKKSVKDQASRRTLHELETLSEQTIEGLRRITRALRPIYLEDLGLVTALEMLANETGQNSGMEIGFRQTGEEQRLSHEMEVALYRIAQEGLNNVIRHAHAKNADLRLSFQKNRITLEVSDDGIGFQIPKSPTDFVPNGHFGLLGIRERVDLIGGRLEVKSTPGTGTRLTVHLP